MNAQRTIDPNWLIRIARASPEEDNHRPDDHGAPVSDTTFEQWIDREYEVVYRYLLSRTRNEDDARDLTQETFVKAYRARNRYRIDQPLRPWLLSIATNCQRDFSRRIRRANSFCAECVTPVESRYADPLATEIEGVLPRLTKDQRMTLHLRVAEQLSFKEIADVLGCTEAAAKMRVQRAKGRLAKLLGRRIADV